MQQIRPRSLLCPLQLATAVHLHDEFKSRMLTDAIHNMGFGASYSHVMSYIRSAAVSEGGKIDGITEETTLQVRKVPYDLE